VTKDRTPTPTKVDAVGVGQVHQVGSDEGADSEKGRDRKLEPALSAPDELVSIARTAHSGRGT